MKNTRAAGKDIVAFDVGIDAKLPLRDLISMGLQNVFVLTGVFVFPSIIGHSFSLPSETIASLYGAAFISCGVTTLLIAAFFGRMPLVSGPYAGVFTAILALGHVHGMNLGTAFGSLFVASLAWCVLSIPIRGVSGVSLLLGSLKDPAISGVIVLLVMMQIANLALPLWLGKPGQATFPSTNFIAGLVTIVVLFALTMSRVPLLRRLGLLIALAIGAGVFEYFAPIDLGLVAKAPWLVMPRLFEFGFSVNLELAGIFFIILVAINLQTMSMMRMVGGWANEDLPPSRQSLGVLAMMLGSAVAAALGTFSNLPYPANVGILRSTRVASRYVSIATAFILIAMGFCSKVDYIFVVLPVPVLAAAATVLFGVVFVHGIEMLAEVEWTDRYLAAAGFSLMLGFGTLFIDPKVFAALPLAVSFVLQQPIIIGMVPLIIFKLIFAERESVAPAPVVAPEGASTSLP